MGRASKCPVPVSDLIQWDAPFLGEMPLPSGGLPLRAWGAKKKTVYGDTSKTNAHVRSGAEPANRNIDYSENGQSYRSTVGIHV